ncbi:MAG: TIGR04283 family arsenosugar biosynthesis glycosyltransferase [Nitrospira sp.]|nr:TIGR04283 family arsenosugar biosynthesis glycosyltransferase [Nitrospira sp.]
MPSLAAIIPTLNEARALPRTLLSLRQLPLDHVIIVDGGSDDGTVYVARSQVAGIGRRPATVIEAACGRARQMNAGAAQAQSDILLFLHADTRLPPEACREIEQVMSGSRYQGGRFDVQFEDDRGWAWVISRMMNWRSRWTGIATGDQAIFVRRTVFDDLGGFADIPLMEDIEFTQRLKRTGDVVALRATVTTSFRRWEQRGAVRTILHMWLLRLLYWLGVDPHTLHRWYAAIR